MQDFDPIEALAAARHTFGEHGGVNKSIEASTTFTVMAAQTLPDIFAGRRTPDADGCFLYARHFNPTVFALGHELAAIESAEAGYCCSSGMGAISATLTQLCNHGDHIVASNTIYGGSFALMNEYLPLKCGVETTFVDVTDHDAVRAAFHAGTRVLFVESVSNPTLKVADLPALADIAHKHGAKLVVDNTFAPILLSPLRLGADVVVHSLTKFINGASDIVAGAICASEAFIADLMDLYTGSLMLLGPTMDPKTAFEISMRLPHLGIRMRAHSERAMGIARRLHERGLPVVYPGLESHPQHQLFCAQLNKGYGFGGLLTLDLGSLGRANAFMEHLQNRHGFGFMAVSLGYSDTLMSASGASTSSELPEDALEDAGIGAGLVRLSMGYTGTLEQRWDQLEDTLRYVGMLG